MFKFATIVSGFGHGGRQAAREAARALEARVTKLRDVGEVQAIQAAYMQRFDRLNMASCTASAALLNGLLRPYSYLRFF